jgi:hypothetical protein
MIVLKNFYISVVVYFPGWDDSFTELIPRISRCVAEKFQLYEILLTTHQQSHFERICLLTKKIPHVRTLLLQRKPSFEVSLYAGLQSAIGDVVVTLNPYTDPIERITDIALESLDHGQMSWGICQNPIDESIIFRAVRRSYDFVANHVLGFNYAPGVTYFRAYPRSIINHLKAFASRTGHLKFVGRVSGLEQRRFEYMQNWNSRTPRRRNLLPSIVETLDMTLTNSVVPIRLISSFTLVGSLVNLSIAAFHSSTSSQDSAVTSYWVALSSASALFMLSLMLVVLGEYLGRILSVGLQFPIFTVARECSSSNQIDETTFLNVSDGDE